MMKRSLLTTKEAADYLRLSTSHLYRLTMLKQIPFVKPTGKLLFDIEDLKNWMKKGDIK